MQDITLRALDVLKHVDYIACEDTRRTGILLKQLGIAKKHFLVSYYEQSEQQRIPNILNLLINGQDVALVSDAGTPLISDPGFKLVRTCIQQGIKVESVPGPSSIFSALVVSGLPTDKFMFVGYLPHTGGKREKVLQDIKAATDLVKSTVIMFEAPHKLQRTLQEMKDVFGDIKIVLARELTKIHEEVATEKISDFIQKYSSQNPRGEFVVLFNKDEQNES